MEALLSHLTGAVLMVCIASSFGLTSRQLTSIKLEEFNGRIMSKFSRERISGISLVYCHIHCLKDEGCMSFFYDYVNMTCQTHGVVFFNPDDGDLLPGITYYKPVQDLCPSALGYIYNRALNFCYKPQYVQTMNYSSARQVCQNEGGDLVTTDTKGKFNHILQTIDASTFPSTLFLVGAHGGFAVGDWQWVGGQEIEADLWCPERPDAADGSWDTALVLFNPDGSGCIRDFADWMECNSFCELAV